jgi:broad specificity phosphatase PhoE
LVDIYLLRHAHVDYTPPSTITAHNALTPLGHQMAERLAALCQAFDLDLLVASPLRRTRETAAAIREACPNLPYLEMPEFAELTITDLAAYMGIQPDEDMHTWADGHYAHGNARMWERVAAGWERLLEIIDERGAERVALVTHGGPLNAIVRHVLGWSEPVRLRNAWIHFDYTATSCVRYVEGWQGIVWLNDARHIEDLAPVRQVPS